MASKTKPPRSRGRPKGTPNKFTADVKQMVLDALRDAGGVAYLTKVAKRTPGVFVPLLAKIMPTQVTQDGNVTITHKVTSE